MRNPLEVKFGSIYTTSGKLTMIDNMGLVVHKENGIIKWGSMDSIDGSKTVRDFYLKRLEECKSIGLLDEASNLVLLEFDRYDGVLSIEDICTLCNSLIVTGASYARIMHLLNLDEGLLRLEIEELKTFGY